MSRDLYGKLKAQRGDVPIELSSTNTFESFQEEIDAVEEGIKSIREYIQELEMLQKKTYSAFSEAEANELEAQLDQVTNAANSLSGQISNKIKVMQERINAKPQDAETQMQKNLHTALTRKFMGVLSEYQNSQKSNRDACRDRFVRQYRIVNPNASEDEIQAKLAQNTPQGLFSSQLLESTRSQRGKQALQAAEDRHRDVERIGKSILEVNQLFMELQRLVDQQGETLDRIEANVNNVAVNVETGTKELTSAIDSAKAARKKKQCLCITFVIVLLIIIIFLVIYFVPGIINKGGSSPSPAPAPAPAPAPPPPPSS